MLVRYFCNIYNIHIYLVYNVNVSEKVYQGGRKKAPSHKSPSNKEYASNLKD